MRQQTKDTYVTEWDRIVTNSNPHAPHFGIVGAGLSAHIFIALAKSLYPLARITVFDRMPKDSFSSHSWCIFKSDLSSESYRSLRPFAVTSWPAYRIKIGSTEREIESEYLFFSPQSFSPLRAAVSNWHVVDFRDEDAPDLASQVRSIESSLTHILDARGWSNKNEATPQAYQKFFGVELEYDSTHSLSTPVLMETNERQIDGYRFTYTLPISSRRLLLEDTFFSLSPELDKENSLQTLLRQAAQFGSFTVVRQEQGVLPLPYQPHALDLVKNPVASRKGEVPILKIGARARTYNALTGYTFPASVRQCEAILKDIESEDLEFSHYAEELNKLDAQNRFFELLNRMLYFSTPPERAYLIMERFYSLKTETIERLYGSRITPVDQLKIFALNPKVNRWSAFKCLIKNQPREFYGSELTR